MELNWSGDTILSSIQNEIQAAAEQQIIDALSAIRCPIHGQSAQNIWFEG
ncbi:hypothetical protein LEP3755_66030 (plasmid) [Leptolyngbya sp. NIES-3755]|nr:hypothetical protein LEP3755_66030 [Leptolyngbya sp. NIES-3755]